MGGFAALSLCTTMAVVAAEAASPGFLRDTTKALATVMFALATDLDLRLEQATAALIALGIPG
jgi:hypothetical protein